MSNQVKLAKLISIILGPHILLPLLFLFFFTTVLFKESNLFIFSTYIFIQVFIPIFYLTFGPKFGWITSWDIKDRKQRFFIFKLEIILNLLTCFVALLATKYLLFKFNLIILFSLIIFYIITLKYKISLHVSLVTLFFLTINYYSGWKYLILILTIPVVAWARIKLKRHTLNQVLLGIIATAVIFLISVRILKI